MVRVTDAERAKKPKTPKKRIVAKRRRKKNRT